MTFHFALGFTRERETSDPQIAQILADGEPGYEISRNSRFFICGHPRNLRMNSIVARKSRSGENRRLTRQCAINSSVFVGCATDPWFARRRISTSDLRAVAVSGIPESLCGGRHDRDDTMYTIRPRELPLVLPVQLEALDRRWRLSAQMATFRNPASPPEESNPFRPRVILPHRRQRPV